MTTRHDLLDRVTELQLSDLLGLGVHHLESLLRGAILNEVLVLVVHHGVDMHLLVVRVLGLPAELQANGANHPAGSATVKLDHLVVSSSLSAVEGAIAVNTVVGGGGGKVSLPKVRGGVAVAGGAVAGVGVDGVLPAVGDDVDLSLPVGDLGLGDHLASLVDGEEVALAVPGVEDWVLNIILFLATHGRDRGLRHLTAKVKSFR